MFSTTLSNEYSVAADTFNLSRDQVWQLSLDSIDHLFSDDEVKRKLRHKWGQLKDHVFADKHVSRFIWNFFVSYPVKDNKDINVDVHR